jgi:stage II sporulation protein AA (anti-sigma F factor antagonist)
VAASSFSDAPASPGNDEGSRRRARGRLPGSRRWSTSAVTDHRAGSSAGVGMEVTSVPPSTAVLALSGEHDITTAVSLERTAGAQLGGCDRLVVDLSATTFVDSSVINALVRVARQARPRGVTFQVVALPETHVHRVLDLMGLLDHLGCIGCLPEMQAVQGVEPHGVHAVGDPSNGASHA